MTNKKLEYAIPCDRLRQASDFGEHVWQSLMSKAERITFEEFTEACNLDGFLEEGETFEDYVAEDDWAGCYSVDTGGNKVVFIQRIGFELFFTHDGGPPTFTAPLDAFAHEVMHDNGAGIVMLKPNDARIGGRFGYEGPLADIAEDMDCVMSDSPRFRLHRDGRVVAALRVLDGVIDSIYVAKDYRRQGLATQLFNRAQEVYGYIEHSNILTPDGRPFRDSFLPAKETNHSYNDEGPIL